MGRHPPSSARSSTFARWRQQLGFTLIELLVVLFIMATMAGFALLALGDAGRGDKLNAEAARLQDTLQLASEEAEMRGSAIGASIEPDRYQFSIWTHDRWQALDRDSILRTHALPGGMELSLDKPAAAAQNPNDNQVPDLIFYTSGESTAFQIRLADGGATGYYEVSGNGYGVFSLARKSDRP